MDVTAVRPLHSLPLLDSRPYSQFNKPYLCMLTYPTTVIVMRRLSPGLYQNAAKIEPMWSECRTTGHLIFMVNVDVVFVFICYWSFCGSSWVNRLLTLQIFILAPNDWMHCFKQVLHSSNLITKVNTCFLHFGYLALAVCQTDNELHVSWDFDGRKLCLTIVLSELTWSPNNDVIYH